MKFYVDKNPYWMLENVMYPYQFYIDDLVWNEVWEWLVGVDPKKYKIQDFQLHVGELREIWFSDSEEATAFRLRFGV